MNQVNLDCSSLKSCWKVEFNFSINPSKSLTKESASCCLYSFPGLVNTTVTLAITNRNQNLVFLQNRKNIHQSVHLNPWSLVHLHHCLVFYLFFEILILQPLCFLHPLKLLLLYLLMLANLLIFVQELQISFSLKFYL